MESHYIMIRKKNENPVRIRETEYSTKTIIFGRFKCIVYYHIYYTLS